MADNREVYRRIYWLRSVKANGGGRLEIESERPELINGIAVALRDYSTDRIRTGVTEAMFRLMRIER